jgi:hypothetical protein
VRWYRNLATGAHIGSGAGLCHVAGLTPFAASQMNHIQAVGFLPRASLRDNLILP